jgi:hypothetical protein
MSLAPAPIRQLAERIRAIENGARGPDRDQDRPPRVDAGWAELPKACVPEWFSDDEPPLCIFGDLAHRSLEGGGAVVWIGRRVWPHPRVLIREQPPGGRRLFRASIMVDPSRRERDWAIEVSLRSPAVAAVIADGSGLTMARSRCIQLAAESRGAAGPLVLLARPVGELDQRSVATFRWLVEPDRVNQQKPGWRVTLRRCKDAGFRGIYGREGRTWDLCWSGDAGLMHQSAAVGDRPMPARLAV